MAIEIAARLRRIEPSPSVAASQRARELKAEGRDVIALSSGEPDFPTPEHVIEAAAAAARRGETKYTSINGTLDLRRAIAGKLARENGLDYSADEIMVSTGGKQAIYNALVATLD